MAAADECKPPGEACKKHGQCCSGNCEGGRCAAPECQEDRGCDDENECTTDKYIDGMCEDAG